MSKLTRRKCQRCRRIVAALYTVWKESGSYEDRIALCGPCLTKHNRTAPELRGLRIAQGQEAFEVPTLRSMVQRQAAEVWRTEYKLHPKARPAVDQVEAALAAQNGGEL